MTSILSQQPVLVTGGGGFIGANLIRKLLKLEKYQIHLIWKKTTNPWRIKDILSSLKIYEVNLLDKTKLTKIIKKIKPEFIFHLATYSAYRQQEDVDEMIKVNIEGTLNFLLASKEIDYKIFVNTGSSSEYGFKNKAIREEDVLKPVSFYAASKASTTLLCQVFAHQYQKPIVTLRPFSVYGPYEETDRFIPTIIKAVSGNKAIKLTPGGERRDFIYVADVINAYLKIVEPKNRGKLSGKILNIGTGKEYTNDEVVETLFKIAKKKIPIKRGLYPPRIWDTVHWVADISQAKKLLNWRPKFSLEEGLLKTYSWFKKNLHLYSFKS